MKTCGADLSIWGGGGAERRKKGEQQRERPRGSGQGLFKPHYSLSQLLRVECVFASIELKKKLLHFVFFSPLY